NYVREILQDLLMEAILREVSGFEFALPSYIDQHALVAQNLAAAVEDWAGNFQEAQRVTVPVPQANFPERGRIHQRLLKLERSRCGFSIEIFCGGGEQILFVLVAKQ